MGKNKRIGASVENYVADKVGGSLAVAVPFDVLQGKVAYEVKSCFTNINDGHKKNGDLRTANRGRFAICIGSHKRFKDETNCMGFEAKYYFVLKGRSAESEWFLVKERVLSWGEVDALLAKGKLTHRYDSVDFVLLGYRLIFPKEGY